MRDEATHRLAFEQMLVGRPLRGLGRLLQLLDVVPYRDGRAALGGNDAMSRIETSTDVYGSSNTAWVKLKSSRPIQAGPRPISALFPRPRRQLDTATMSAKLSSKATPIPPCSIAVATSEACGLNVINPETPAPHSDGSSASRWANDRRIDPAPCPATGRSQSKSQPAFHQRIRLPALVSNRRVETIGECCVCDPWSRSECGVVVGAVVADA